MYRDLEKIKDMMMYKALEMDAVAHANGENLTITIASEEIADILVCISELLALGYIDIDKVEEWHTYKVDREIERARERRKIA